MPRGRGVGVFFLALVREALLIGLLGVLILFALEGRVGLDLTVVFFLTTFLGVGLRVTTFLTFLALGLAFRVRGFTQGRKPAGSMRRT